ncbi:hypothetical protein DFH27DRAFT_609885 [Peziza echinospora]|nr:hypothetical protein DFH27DRAFT_609885 [Peziza echinospora]
MASQPDATQATQRNLNSLTFSASMGDYHRLVTYMHRNNIYFDDMVTTQPRSSRHMLITVAGRDTDEFEDVARDAGISIVEVTVY